MDERFTGRFSNRGDLNSGKIMPLAFSKGIAYHNRGLCSITRPHGYIEPTGLHAPRLEQDKILNPEKKASVIEVKDLYWSNVIKTIRKKLKLSQAKFARKFDFRVATVQTWEGGQRRPAYLAQKVILAIAEKYGVKLG